MAPSSVWTLPGTPHREWDVTAVRHKAEGAVDRSLEDLDERALVDACLAGRTGAFDLIVERHRRHVYQLCYRFVSDHEDASDLSQDVFIRAFRAFGIFAASRRWEPGCIESASTSASIASARNRREPSRSGSGSMSIRALNPRPITCSRRARGTRQAGDRAVAAEAARDADPPHVSRAVASGDRDDPRQFGGRGQGEFLSRAGQSQEAAARRWGSVMRHLTSEQLVDVAEGVRTEPSMPHLQSCEACRTKLAELRTTLSAAGEVDVPEPSPLFWDHFSARVHEAVEAERANRTFAFGRWSSWRTLPLWLGSLAAVILAIVIVTRGRVSEAPAPPGPVGVVVESQAEAPASVDDASLSLVADLVTDLDWDGAVEAGLTPHLGSADDVLTELNDDERRELNQLLRVELDEKYKVQSRKYKVS